MYDERRFRVKQWRRWPGVMGWTCVVLTVVGVFALTGPFFFALFVPTALALGGSEHDLPIAMLVVLVLGGSLLVTMVTLHLCGGIWLIRRDRRAERPLKIYALAMMVFHALGIVSIGLMGAFSSWADDIGETVLVLVPLVVLGAWPVFVWTWLRRPRVRREMARWARRRQRHRPVQLAAPPAPLSRQPGRKAMGWQDQWNASGARDEEREPT